MTVHLYQSSARLSAAEPLPCHSCSSEGSNSPSSNWGTGSSQRSTEEETHPSTFWQHLLEILPDGVLLLTSTLRLVYCSSKAHALCQRLLPDSTASNALPAIVIEACQTLTRPAKVKPKSLMVECTTPDGLTIRIRAHWIEPTPYFVFNVPVDRQPLICLLLEDRGETLQDDLHIEKQKYDLTEREAEIWSLLRRDHTYQDIAQMLQISLNTVKTHVKNVYAKKRSHQVRDSLWIF